MNTRLLSCATAAVCARSNVQAPPRRWLPRFLLVAVCVFGVGPSYQAQAQNRAYKQSLQTPLKAEDVDAMNAATKRLLDRPQLAEGGMEVWSSQRSGASGTVVAGKTLTRSGMACRVVNYFTNVPSVQSNRTTVLTWCKTQDSWKIAG